VSYNQRILCFDLENTAMLSYHWSRWGVNISPAQTVEESRVLCFGAKWVGGDYVFKAAYEHGREEMLTTINDLLTEADAVISWNGVRHDSKKIKTEFILEGMTPPSPWKEIDLMRVAKNQFAFSSNSLNLVSQQLGVGSKVKHEGFFEIIPKVQSGDPVARRKFERYQKQDVVLLEKLYKKLLPWIPKTMHPNLSIGSAVPVCPKCASSKIQWRGYGFNGTGAYRKFRCQSCGSYSQWYQREVSSGMRPA
jgi:hypothetical protein